MRRPRVGPEDLGADASSVLRRVARPAPQGRWNREGPKLGKPGSPNLELPALASKQPQSIGASHRQKWSICSFCATNYDQGYPEHNRENLRSSY
jgi:hypothetical protein